MKPFAARLLAWFERHGRHDLPWQRDRDPYRIWVSEVMLQQTQVATVIAYFERFIAAFPTVTALADADEDAVLALWSGLGYYARARNLQAAARHIRDAHGGVFPRSFDAVSALPGVGPSTAGAILALAFDARHAILDGNCKRVYARHEGVEGWPGESAVNARLWALAETRTPESGVAAYTQAIMDLGATVCTRAAPRCDACPVADDCVANATGRVAEIPAPRPRRARPHRTATLLVVRDTKGAFLLERRPGTGVWGGLWCPPLTASREEAAEILGRFGVRYEAGREHPPVRHGFTHFTLEIHPHESVVDSRHGEVAESDHRWIAPTALADIGLPAPVRGILTTLG